MINDIILTSTDRLGCFKMSAKIRLIIIAFVLLVATLACTLLFTEMEPNFEIVDQAYVKEHVGNPGYILVDVLPKESYDGKSVFEGVPGGHIPGAINFPGEDLKIPGAAAALARAGITKNVTVILYCAAGRTSLQFAEALVKDFKFKDYMIKHYKGGIIDWIKSPFNKLEPENHDSVTDK